MIRSVNIVLIKYEKIKALFENSCPLKSLQNTAVCSVNQNEITVM